MKKFNWLDIVIILLVLAVAGGAWYMLRPSSAVEGEITAFREDRKVRVVVEVKERAPEVADAFVVGETVTFGPKNIDRGEIVDVEIRDHDKVIENYDAGRFAVATTADRKDVFVTIEFDGVETEDVISTGNEDVSVGTMTVLHGKGFAAAGAIVGVSVND